MTASPDPFTALGLPARPDLSDEQVRAAWRQVATATHPDRPDGGDPARYAAASGAYAILRTAWGRSEAYADLAAPPLAGRVVPPATAARPLRVDLVAVAGRGSCADLARTACPPGAADCRRYGPSRPSTKTT
jgi:hypothetical protein